MNYMTLSMAALGAAVLAGCTTKVADDPADAANAELRRAVAVDVATAVRPGGVNGRPFWNGSARLFMYPPAFDFKSVEGAKKYRYRVTSDEINWFSFEAKTPNRALESVWSELQPGWVTLKVDALGADGRTLGPAGEKKFWKSAPYEPGTYPAAPWSYGEAASRYYDFLWSMKNTRSLAENGVGDEKYRHNAYPSKIYSALIEALVDYAKRKPEKSAEILEVAKKGGDYLISLAQPAGTPLAGFTPTYLGTWFEAGKYAGQNMLIYPATVARAFLDLAKATGETRYREAAERIAATYLKLQGEDGTWFLKMTAADGKGVGANRLVPIQCVTPMFERLFAETGKPEYRKAADRSFASVEGRLSDWNWEGQFEDVPPTARYENLTKHDACSTAIYLAGRCPDDPTRRNQVRELLRFAEDQFVCWEPPFRNGRLPSAVRGKLWSGNYDVWVTPCALEQYNCHWPIDASAAKLIRTYLAVYRLEGRREDLAKARALGDTATRMQCADGRIPTWWWPARAKVVSADWINCMLAMADALMELDEFKETP